MQSFGLDIVPQTLARMAKPAPELDRKDLIASSSGKSMRSP